MHNAVVSNGFCSDNHDGRAAGLSVAPVGMGVGAIKVHCITPPKRMILPRYIDHHFSLENENDFGSGVHVRFRNFRFHFDVVCVQLSIVYRVIKRLEKISWRAASGLVRKPYTIGFPHYGDQRPLGVGTEKML